MILDPPIAFAGAPLDLAEHRRSAAELTAFSKAKNARALVMYHGQFLTKGGKLALVKPMDVVGKNLYDPGPLFLGIDGKTPLFAFSFGEETEAQDMVRGAKLEHLRAVGTTLPAKDLAQAGRAKALFEWHRTHKFCAQCGKDSIAQHGGITRKCPSCNTDHFPRVNPVVIMLVLHGDECLLGRGANWPEGAFSALAGFVAPGETLEEACTREVYEEVGIAVTDAQYKFSQPWPYPSQLMMGLFCEAKTKKITLDTNEVADAKWFSKDTVRGVFAGTDNSFLPLPEFTIAHELLKHWLES